MLSGAYVRLTLDEPLSGATLLADWLTGGRLYQTAPERGFDGINHPSALNLIVDGIEVAFLYGGTPGSSSGKDFTGPQYRDYRSHGIRCAFVFEHLSDDWRGGAAAGRANASALLADLKAKGTDGTDPVACSVDEHVATADLPTVVAYVTAFARAIAAAGYRGPCGVYGFAEVLDAVHAAGVVAWYWCAGSRSTVPAYANVWQDNTQHVEVGGSADDLDWILVPLPQEVLVATALTTDDIPAIAEAAALKSAQYSNAKDPTDVDMHQHAKDATAALATVNKLAASFAAEVQAAVAAGMAKVVNVHVDVTGPTPAAMLVPLAADTPAITKWQALWTTIKSGGWLSIVQTLFGIGVTVGILTADQDQALLAVATGVLNLVQVVQAAVHLFQGATQIRAADRLARANAQMARELTTLRQGADGVYRAAR